MKVPRDGMNLVLIRAVPVRESCAKSSASSPVLHSDTTLDKGIEHIQFVSKGLQSQIQNYQKEAARLGRSENRATLTGSFSISRTYGICSRIRPTRSQFSGRCWAPLRPLRTDLRRSCGQCHEQ